MELKKNNTLLDAALKSKSDNLLEVQKEVCLLLVACMTLKQGG